ncbi:TPA: carboxylating nicotinate-nucleotide diphosphorylase [Candidatus Micrarchaeota archaeon]|nr:carboxylating nicotinate-nucleotide diphosphorylase [Candidatus Micrarchaeota archaeon]
MGWQGNFLQEPNRVEAEKTALQSLWEDASHDITSSRAIPPHLRCSGRIVAKSNFALCGLLEANAIFKSRLVKASWRYKEGQRVKKGRVVCTVAGNCRAVLACERTALNYLSLLSGISTKCAFASKMFGKWKISATRKTLPHLSDSEKRAVKIGGCLTHRMRLGDGILVKDNHIAAIMNDRKVKRAEAVKIAVSSFEKGKFVEIEVSSVRDAVAAAESGAGAILVDNVSPNLLRKIARQARKINRKTVIESSGGISLKNAGKFLRAGATFCSTSELTMRIEPANLSLEIDYF